MFGLSEGRDVRIKGLVSKRLKSAFISSSAMPSLFSPVIIFRGCTLSEFVVLGLGVELVLADDWGGCRYLGGCQIIFLSSGRP